MISAAFKLLIASLTAAPLLFSASAVAWQMPLAADGPNLTIDQVRGAYLYPGYEVEPALSWDWTSPPVTSFQVHDLATGRVLMVLVYSDAAAAKTEQRQALANEADPTVGDPHLVAGFGRSVLTGNVDRKSVV